MVHVQAPNLYKVACKKLPANQIASAIPPSPTGNTKPQPATKLLFDPSIHTLQLDQLDEAVRSTFDKEESIPSTTCIKEAIGKTMYPRSFALQHSTAPMLDSWGQHGCPANCGPHWSKDQIITALKRGPHQSELSPKAINFLRDKVTSKVSSGYAKTVRWGDIKTDIPPCLKISPVAMVPHKSRSF